MQAYLIPLVIINLVGGALIIFSYYHGLKKYPTERGAVWGGVPAKLKPWYTVSMLLAAAGYLVFLGFIFLRLDWVGLTVGVVIMLYFFTLLVLIRSAVWMPLTFAMLHRPSRRLWWLIRLTLARVALGSLGLLAALLCIRGYEGLAVYWLAVAGMVFFCIQTVLLDALVWTYYFKRKAVLE
jgi:hypothetical protein